MRTRSTFWGYMLISPAVLLLIVLLFIPLLYTLQLSLQDTDLTHGDPTWIGFRGYVESWADGEMWNVTKHSIVWTICVAGFQVIIGLLVAIALNQKFPLRWLVRALVLLPWVLPGVVAALTWRLIYDSQFGFMNSLIGKLGFGYHSTDWLGTPGLAMFSVILAAIWKGFPFPMLMISAALQGVSQEQYEAAKIDGADRIKQFFYITLPSISGVLKTVVLLVSIWTFNYFEMIYVLTGGGPIRSTHIAPTYIYELSFRNFNFGEASRVATISFVFVLLISLVLIRQMNKTEKN
ncbi:sugar ABC transporter permease [Paenibacillus alginolyticus]|uniref:Sugar ABC transporter permease n=1 Tax=Paenibacillus alginolyticus TaxID=59839 RepID=A0ABT4GGG9_9BACL|nr:sugar ABC transporter permease [Paenibacillus alginolyticus]MCY9668383.1 sugar ABC transporter permease [Paenibacillus alginolyticus]MCY9695293.1 sugar ABC transporter permease [Paenibacillus alginolyticus]MEC0144815.1 sugar ABC transporter permease [Paenibacillus alginolyticus]